jgi:hypothetical protein
VDLIDNNNGIVEKCRLITSYFFEFIVRNTSITNKGYAILYDCSYLGSDCRFLGWLKAFVIRRLCEIWHPKDWVFLDNLLDICCWNADSFLCKEALGWIFEIKGGPVILELKMLEATD